MEWYNYPKGRGFTWTPSAHNNHSGIDMQLPWDTPVHAAVGGRVLFAKCQPWGGQVDILTTYLTSSFVLSFLHLHQMFVTVGQIVDAGTLVGRSGGDERGPCTTAMPTYSDGPHMHVEFTKGTVGPYHGGSPYKVSDGNYPVDPSPLIDALRRGAVLPASDVGSPASSQGLPVIADLFAVPAATMEVVDAIPGVDGLLYKLHEVETFPGLKTPQQVLGSQLGFDPGKIVYWLTGNIVGNVTPALVRGTYLSLGLLIFLGLMIAFASAQAEKEIDVIKDIAPDVLPAAL